MKILQDPLTIEDVITRNTTDETCAKQFIHVDDDDLCKALCDGLTYCEEGYSS